MKLYLIDHYINTLKLSSFNVVVKSQPHWAAPVDGSMTLPPPSKWIWSLYNINAYYQQIWALMTTLKKVPLYVRIPFIPRQRFDLKVTHLGF